MGETESVMQNRRDTDRRAALDISQMILNEDDPKQRAFLLALHSIEESSRTGNAALLSRIESNEKRGDRFEISMVEVIKKMETQVDLINKAKGAGWVTSKLVPVLLFVLSVAVGFVNKEVGAVQAAILIQSNSESALRTELVQAINNSNIVDLRLAARMDLLDERCKRLEGVHK